MEEKVGKKKSGEYRIGKDAREIIIRRRTHNVKEVIKEQRMRKTQEK